MQKLKVLLRVVCLVNIILGTVSLVATEKDHKYWVRVNLPLTMSYNANIFENMDIIRYEGMPDNVFEMAISQESYEDLLNEGYQLEILSDDYARTMREISDHFYTNESAYAFIDSLSQLFPGLVKIDSIGTTYEDRTIWCVKISDNVVDDDPQKLGVFYSGSIHANELAGTTVVLSLMDEILTSYSSGDQSMIDWLENHQLWIVPILNPDGVAYVHSSQDIGWRKNRSPSGNGDYGVDLNRNFGYMWGYDDDGSSPDPSQWNYRGSAPFSELESQAIRSFFEDAGSVDRNIVSAITYHMKYNAGVFLYPWYYTDAYTKHHSVYIINGEEFTSITGNTHGTATEAMGYEANGSLDEWLYVESVVKPKIICSTVECGGAGMMPDGYPIDLLLSTHIPANIQHLESTSLIANRVRIVDAIDEPTLSASSYMIPGNDTLHVQVPLLEDSATIEVIGHIIDEDDFPLENILFFDDGNHGDLYANDSIFGASWVVPEDIGEGFFSFYLEGILGDSVSHDLLTSFPFTTAGPIVFDVITSTNDDYPNPDQAYMFNISLMNLSDEIAIPDVAAQITSGYDEINVTTNPASFGTIPAGGSATNLPGRFFGVTITEFELLEVSHYTLGLEIQSEGIHYWSDSLEIVLYPVGIDECSLAPVSFKLNQNYPNPFNPITTISYDLPEQSKVSLTVYDVRGQEIIMLQNGVNLPGNYDVQWNGLDQSGKLVSTGVYFARLEAGEYIQTIKMLYLK